MNKLNKRTKPVQSYSCLCIVSRQKRKEFHRPSSAGALLLWVTPRWVAWACLRRPCGGPPEANQSQETREHIPGAGANG
eukprot:2759202-Pyramimonas_sp.AAC.1